MYAFRDARRKIRRAHDLCDELTLDERRLTLLHESELFAVERRDEWEIRIGAVHEVGDQWSLTLSEIMFHLRSALDHIAYELAVNFTGDPLPADIAEASQFPICTSVNAFETAVRRRGRRPGCLAGVDPALLPLFRRLQPFPHHVMAGSTPGAAPIDEVPESPWLLNEMHRREKHRFPPILTRAALSASWMHDQPEPVVEGGQDGPTQGLQPGDVVARCSKAEGFVPLTQAQPRFTFKVGTILDGRFWNLPGSLKVAAMMVDRACKALTGTSGNPCLPLDVLFTRSSQHH